MLLKVANIFSNKKKWLSKSMSYNENKVNSFANTKLTDSQVRSQCPLSYKTKVLLLISFYHNSLKALRLTFLKYIWWTFFSLSEYWENEGQNWAKNYFHLYELLYKQICDFLCFSLYEMRPCVFLLFEYFWNDLLLIVFVQNVVLKFVKILQ